MASSTNDVHASNLVKKKVLAQHGKQIGEVDAVCIDLDTWMVTAFQVKLERSVLEELDIKQPVLFGTQSIKMSVDHISGVSDAVILKKSIEEISFLPNTEKE